MNQKTIIGIITALVIGLIVGYVIHFPRIVLGAAYTTTDPSTPTALNNLTLTGSSTLQIGIPTNYPQTAPTYGPAICQGGNNGVSTEFCTIDTFANFTYGSTTLAVISNPFNSTSTVSQLTISGTNGTTTVNMQVGTTTGNGAPSSGLSASLINTNISTTSQYYISAGMVGAGYYAGNNTFPSIVVGPLESVVVSATSTSWFSIQGVLFPTSTTTGKVSVEWQR